MLTSLGYWIFTVYLNIIIKSPCTSSWNIVPYCKYITLFRASVGSDVCVTKPIRSRSTIRSQGYKLHPIIKVFWCVETKRNIKGYFFRRFHNMCNVQSTVWPTYTLPLHWRVNGISAYFTRKKCTEIYFFHEWNRHIVLITNKNNIRFLMFICFNLYCRYI